MYASYQKRVVSYFIDIYIGQIIHIAIVLGTAPFVDNIYIAQFLGYLAIVIWTLIDFPILQSSHWQASIGQKLLKIKVTDIHGKRLSFWRASYRISIFTFFIWGIFIYFFSPNKQCLHDFLSDSLVIKNSDSVINIFGSLHSIRYGIIILYALCGILPLLIFVKFAFFN